MLKRVSEGQKRTIAHWSMEFVVVVAGVLLALLLQEWVGDRDERRKRAAAEAAIRFELDDNLMLLVAHTAVDRCLSERLKEIEDRLRGTDPTLPISGHALTVPRPNQPRTGPGVVYAFFDIRVEDSAWESAKASGVLAGMEPAKFNKLAEIYGEYRMVDDALAQATDAGATLQVLTYGTDLTPDLRARLVTAMTKASRSRQFLTNSVNPAFVAGQMRQLGWDDRSAIDGRIADFTKSMHGYGVYLRPCAERFANPFERWKAAPTNHSG